MAQDISLLSQRILKLSRRVEENANAKVINASKAFFEAAVRGTPADTGQAISSWKTGIGFVPQGTRNLAPGKLGSSKGAAISAVLSLELPRLDRRRTGSTVYIVNTTTYISALNAGRSSQAPAGFIDKARLAAGARAKLPRLTD